MKLEELKKSKEEKENLLKQVEVAYQQLLGQIKLLEELISKLEKEENAK